jgi:ATP-dependent DNA helicase DinG
MAQAVQRAAATGRHLVVQAGTGTGKSLAYLLPAILSGKRVVVATATKALQDQLASKDLPFLAAQLGERAPFTFALLKGRSNYLCRQRANETMGSSPSNTPDTGDVLPAPQMLFGPPDLQPPLRRTPVSDTPLDVPAGLGSQIRELLSWAHTSPTGDRAELPFEPHPQAWAAVSVGTRECPGAFRCPSGGNCFAEQARGRAAAADIVVVNTHLYATHVASDGAVLPDHELLIFDEAHEVEEVMANGLGVELTGGRLRALAQGARALLGAEDAGIIDGLLESASRVDSALLARTGQRVLWSPPGRHTDPSHPTPDEELVSALELAGGRVEQLSATLRRSEHNGQDSAAPDKDLSTRRTRALLAAGHLSVDITTLRATGSDSVAWVEGQGAAGRNPVLRSAPIAVGPLLAERLWPKVIAVLTTATVPLEIETRLGLPPETTDRLDVGSPFPYGDAALLYCPTHLPDRRGPDAESALHKELERLILAAGGRTLALFTSWRAMESAVEALRPRLPHRVLAQSDLPKPKLIDAFRSEESACLFATLSFWQGVDVPGATLSLVAIDRLPFPRPDDPVLQARRDLAGEAAFRSVDLPRAATLLAQGVGRLIRSMTDTGVVAVLDRRLATAGYRKTLLAALPPMRFTTDPQEPIAFFHRTLRSASGEPPGQ